ncbi:glycoside hydrolase family 32 protein [Mariniflexile rhizosphaerae]|uniref:glycoside hydrolase family 32 protein n=1 Tax=unclassified Mariniflexile TaxID=2643887 RepID=UPI00214F69BB|nr:glycoside hydrolase family 32 protein [Mariniflexile sp. TRM1-10]
MFLIVSCKNIPDSKAQNLNISQSEEALYRPNFHFTPKEHWMNDPNGMFFLNNTYHLFFQYYPDGNKWGPMHWGHATSKDLIIWEEQPIALYPDELGYIFSGSAVVDTENTSGFGNGTIPPIVAIFTHHDPVKEKEAKVEFENQSIAYSLDNGNTWIKYDNNPVLKNPGIKDFRDPKVLWDEKHQQWVMALAANDRIKLYSSIDLKEWHFLSNFGNGLGAHGGVWECPDFFPMQVENSTEMKWVLLQSLNPGGPNGGSGTQYFIGDFDGKTFSLDPSFNNDLESKKALWIDFGKDNYAGVTWSNIPSTDGRKLFLGWMSNWQYAQQVPTETWRSAMTTPREITLVKNEGRYRLKFLPVRELQNYVSKTIRKNKISITDKTVVAKSPLVDFTKADIQFTVSDLKQDVYTFCLSNSKGESITFGLNKIDHYFFIDRSKSGNIFFSEDFAKNISKAPFNKDINDLDVRIILDKTSIELFYNNGTMVMTEIFFTTQPFDSFSIKANTTSPEIENMIIKQLKIN